MNRRYGIKQEWETHPVYSQFYKLSIENKDTEKDIEWLEGSHGDIIGISIPIKDGSYQSYRRMFKGFDRISREMWEEMFLKAEALE